MSDLKVCCLMLTAGRNFCASRSLSFFLDQDYENKVLLIYQNSAIPQQLDPSIDTSNIILINNNIDSKTGLPYTNLGAIYNDAIKYIPDDVDVVNCYEDDDIRMPYFLSEGVKGYQRAMEENMLAYKPLTSYLRSGNEISAISNVLEASFFINKHYLLGKGFDEVNVSHHHRWLHPLQQEALLLVDNVNRSGYVYTWGENGIPVYKTSGAGETHDNFINYHRFSQDHGNNVIKVLDRELIDSYYNEVEDFIHSQS